MTFAQHQEYITHNQKESNEDVHYWDVKRDPQWLGYLITSVNTIKLKMGNERQKWLAKAKTNASI